MIYDVRQTTTCSYASPVAHAHHVLRLTPVHRDGQRVHLASLQIAPEPMHRREGQDFFGNRLTWIEIEEPHDTLTVKLAARVAVDAPHRAGRQLHAGLGSGARRSVRGERYRAAVAGAFSVPEPPGVARSGDPRLHARELYAGPPILDAAIELIGRLKADIVYEIGATTVTTTPPMSFALRRGVCQDFAHIMISGLRGIGLPAAYVSGYLRSAPRTDATRLQGSEAMHAWVLLWCGSAIGWIGLDPTNAVLAEEDHVMLAIGRDYTDVAPVDGVILGSGGQRMDVSVSVMPIA